MSTTSTVVSVSSKLSSLKAQIDEDDVKSIFVGATKYEILNYLEDAKERGVDNLSNDLGTGIEGMYLQKSNEYRGRYFAKKAKKCPRRYKICPT